jgi:indole-3-glycerol phosphate synthase
LRDALSRPGGGLICEIKKASPSRGPIDLSIDVARRAREYEVGGARALSVLTEPHWFAGSVDDLSVATRAVGIPVLCKDFVVDPYQIDEAAARGASAVLLIVAALTWQELTGFLTHAHGLGLDALVEVHTEVELELALDCGAGIVGVNNRDLKTLAVDLGVSQTLIPRIGPGKIAVVESGISSPQEISRFSALGARAFLIGESLMRSSDPTDAVRRLAAALVRSPSQTAPSS